MIMKVKLYNRRHFALVVMAVLVPLLATACSGGRVERRYGSV